MDDQFSVGDALLASRAQEFPDGELAYLRANGPDVIAVEKDEVEDAKGGGEGEGG